ncbi:hypothetical protein [Nocardioides sp. GY 10127]|uniref:hypothetical protein n=1 Tax=Nocardioides sp. GY 10127 TaxID=2569762 RepID=UPI0010A7CA95|nr:hypothetical protein [Nocardioides sp. GY 10127]TIC78788.1 hypothetical protein E8D37_19015 [Nocardioides sp. GY 10127]
MTRSAGRQPKRAKRRNPAAWSHEVEYLYTLGPEVADVAAESGLIPDENQQWILDQTFGVDANGKPAAFEVDLIGPRQNIKTSSIIMMELGWLYVTEEPFILHTAHELDAAEEAFIDLRERLLDTPLLRKELNPAKGDRETPGIYTGNGSWEIHLLNGSRLKYKARGKDSGRALTADKLVLDEGFSLVPAQVGSLYPILTTIPDAQVIVASSAGKLYSDVLREHRTRGRKGLSPRQFYAEWGDTDPWDGCKARDCEHALDAVGCALDDEERWARIMPAWGLRVFPETIRNMRQAMPPLEFAREFMVWWEDPAATATPGVLDFQKWTAPVTEGGCLNPSAPSPSGRVELMLDVSPDRRSSTIGAASTIGSRTLVITTTIPGTDRTVEALGKLHAKRKIKSPVALVPNSQAGALIPDLVKAGIPWEPLTSVQVGQATAAFIEGVSKGRIMHVGQPEFDKAVENATTKFTARGEAEVWDRRDKTISIGPVVAGSGAAFRLALKKPPAPAPRRVGSSPAAGRGHAPNIATTGF